MLHYFLFESDFYRFVETYACPILDIALLIAIIWHGKRKSK